MRPIKLEIEGIQSFTSKEVVDFERISKNGIFGIFGETGSGKSTILDCIILSLYGKITRSKVNSDFINLKMDSARVLFVFSISDGSKIRKFEVERNFKRSKKNRRDVDQLAEVREHLSLGKRQVAEGKFAVDKYLTQILGMSDQEFLKCIVLPQGEFAGFLKAKPAERMEIIGNIFDLNKYGQEFWEKLSKRRELVDREVEFLRGKYASTDPTSSAEIENLESELEKTRNELKLEQIRFDMMNEKKSSLDDLIALQVSQREVERKIFELEKQRPKIEEKKILLSQTLEFDKVRGIFSQRDDFSNKVESEKKSLVEVVSVFEENKRIFDETTKKYEENFDEISREIDDSTSKLILLRELQKKQPVLEELKQRQHDVKTLILELGKNKNQSLQKISELSKKADENENTINNLKGIVEKNQEKIDLYNSLINSRQISKQIEVIENFCMSIDGMREGKLLLSKQTKEEIFELSKNEKKLRADVTKIVDSIDKVLLGDAKNSYEKLRKIERRLFEMKNAQSKIRFLQRYIDEITAENETYLESVKKIETEVKIINDDIVSNDAIIAQIEEELESERNEREGYLGQNVLSIMLEHTNIGDDCPICRSQIVQKTATKKTDISIYDKNIIAIKRKLSLAKIKRDKIVFSLASRETMIEELATKISLGRRKQEDLKKDIEGEQIKFVDINKQSEANFEGLLERLSGVVCKVEKLISAEENIRESLEKIESKRIELGSRAMVYGEVANELSEIYSIFESERAERELLLLDSIGDNDITPQSLADLGNKMRDSNTAEKEIQTLSRQRENLLDELFIENKSLDKFQSEIERNEEKFAQIGEQIAEIEGQIRRESFGNLDKYIESFEDKLREKKEKLKSDRETLDELNKKILQIENEIKYKQRVIDQFELQIDEIDVGLEKTRDILGIKLIGEAKKFDLSAEEKSEIQQVVDDFSSEITLLRKEDFQNKQKLAGNFANEVEYKKIVSQLSTLTGEQNARREKIGKIQVLIENKKKSLIEREDISAKIETLTKKQTYIKELSDLTRGKALLEYVAEEYIDDIIKIASRKLMLLKGGEFSLVLEDKEFFIIDNFNDGHKRSANTLSGGETFIVSLSIALAISEAIIMSSNKSMDFFFLDEGFDTLDTQLCETVVNSLVKLESQNLVIGLITHKVELQEAITSKIIVKKNEVLGSTLEYKFSI